MELRFGVNLASLTFHYFAACSPPPLSFRFIVHLCVFVHGLCFMVPAGKRTGSPAPLRWSPNQSYRRPRELGEEWGGDSSRSSLADLGVLNEAGAFANEHKRDTGDVYLCRLSVALP